MPIFFILIAFYGVFPKFTDFLSKMPKNGQAFRIINSFQEVGLINNLNDPFDFEV
jgi:hypothetical protein